MIKNTKTINMKKLLSIIALMGLILIIGCNKSDDNLSDEEKIVGTWKSYLSVDAIGNEYPMPSPEDEKINVLEFKTNGTAIFNERGDINIFRYTLDDDIVEMKWQDGSVFTNWRVLKLNSTELWVEKVNDGRQWRYKRQN